MNTNMNFININGDDNDLFYRYKMPDIKIQYQSSGNGIKTNIININQISKSLQRDIKELSKAFNILLKTNCKYKENSLLINGRFEIQQLKEILNNYIQTFIICERCHLPETIYKIKKKYNKLYLICNACGNIKKLINDDLDLDKIKKYIISH